MRDAPGRYPLAAPGHRGPAQATLCSTDCSCCFSKTRTISSTGSSLVSGRNFHTNTMASAQSPAKMTMTPPRLSAFWLTGKISMIRKLASQSIIAQNAAAWPRTAVGKTSPCRVHPVPPTPTANEAMKKSSPIMITTSRAVPDMNARPSAVTSAKMIIPV
jgi:hypothetical protein